MWKTRKGPLSLVFGSSHLSYYRNVTVQHGGHDDLDGIKAAELG